MAVDVLRVERRDEGLLQQVEGVVDDFIALVFEDADLGCGSSQPRVADADALQEHAGRLANDVHLFEKERVEFVFAGKEFHIGSV